MDRIDLKWQIILINPKTQKDNMHCLCNIEGEARHSCQIDFHDRTSKIRLYHLYDLLDCLAKSDQRRVWRVSVPDPRQAPPLSADVSRSLNYTFLGPLISPGPALLMYSKAILPR